MEKKTELTEISDEDAIEVAKICGIDTRGMNIVKRSDSNDQPCMFFETDFGAGYKRTGCISLKYLNITVNNGMPVRSLKAIHTYQYLASKNYDLPVFYKSAREVELEQENERLREALGRDKTGLASGLDKIYKLTKGYDWVMEGRGCYAFDDERYKSEMGNFLNQVKDLSITTLRESGALVTKELNEGLFKKP